MPYADVFLIPIPRKKLAAYKKMAQLGARIWKKHGALAYYETLADDLRMPWGGIPFGKAARCKPGETLVVAWIVYRSKAHRDRVNAKVHADPRLREAPKKMPFDPKRMSYGGFRSLVVG